MQRLVIALTAFLALMAGMVVVGYLLIFAAATDRASRAVPAEASVYATLYLQPSAGQKMNLAALLGHVPGLADPTSLDQKLHEIAARLLSEAGIDYEGDLRPWLGNQLALAVEPGGTDPAAAQVIALVAVKDPDLADAALDRIAADLRLTGEPEAYHGVDVTIGPDGAWALLDDLLVLGNDAEAVHAALDADEDRVPSLADDQEFLAAMRRVPADHLASLYVDLRGLAEATGSGDQLGGGYSDASLALLVEQNGLRLTGSAPFDAESAPAAAREAFALASEPSSLADWMPDDTEAEVVFFGLAQTLLAAKEQLGTDPATSGAADAINQLRAVAAFGLGIDLEKDLLPLFDREAALAVGGLGQVPAGQLLLRPADADAAAAALDRVRDALRGHGATVTEEEADGVTITSIDVPDIGSISYASRDGVIIAGLDPDDVADALSAATQGTTLGASARYRSAWELAGAHGGNEFWVDIAAAIDAAGADLGVTGDLRDILLQIDALAMTAPAHEETSEFHLVLTAR